MKKRGYIFTKKKHPIIGIMSTILGLISILSDVYGIVSSFAMRGQVPGRYGFAGALTLIYSFAGMLMALLCFKKEGFRLFPILGVVFNGIGILAAVFILWVN